MKRPAAFGFYSPAKEDADAEGSHNRKRVKEVSILVLCQNFFIYVYIHILQFARQKVLYINEKVDMDKLF